MRLGIDHTGKITEEKLTYLNRWASKGSWPFPRTPRIKATQAQMQAAGQ